MNISLDSILSEEDLNGTSRRSSNHNNPNDEPDDNDNDGNGGNDDDNGGDDGYDSNSFSSGGGQGSMSSSAASSVREDDEEDDDEDEDLVGVVGVGVTSPNVNVKVNTAAGAASTPQQYFHTPTNETNPSPLITAGTAGAAAARSRNEYQLQLPDIRSLSPPEERTGTGTSASTGVGGGSGKGKGTKKYKSNIPLQQLSSSSGKPPSGKSPGRNTKSAGKTTSSTTPYETIHSGNAYTSDSDRSYNADADTDHNHYDDINDQDSYVTDDSDSHISYFNAKGGLKGGAGAGLGSASVAESDGFSAFTDAFENDDDMDMDMDMDSMISYDTEEDDKGKKVKAIASMDTIDFSKGKGKKAGNEGEGDAEAGTEAEPGTLTSVVQSFKRIMNPSRLFYTLAGTADDDDNGEDKKRSASAGSGSGSGSSPRNADGGDEETAVTGGENDHAAEVTPSQPPSSQPSSMEELKSSQRRGRYPMRVDSMISRNKEPPSLARAWAYFEHHMLPRYIVTDDSDEDDDDANANAAEPSTSGSATATAPATAPVSTKHNPHRFRHRPEGNPVNFITEDVLEPTSMTYSRRIALYLSQYSWYNKGKQLTPEERGVVEESESESEDGDGGDDGEGKQQQQKQKQQQQPKKKKETYPKTLYFARPGTDMYETRLYSIIHTPLSQMGDFGLGIGLYFVTLRALQLITFLSGCISIYNMNYFASDAYNGIEGEAGSNFDGSPSVPWYLRGSAVCTRHEWVLCPTCRPDNYEEDAQYRLYIHDDGTVFALKNRCEGTIFRVGMVTFSTIVITTIGLIMTYRWLRYMEVKFDEDEQTAQDYSIIIRNVPNDDDGESEGVGGDVGDEAVEEGNHARCNIYDPRVWSNFFETKFPGSHVTCSTVVVDNDDLLQALVTRREIIKALDDALELMGIEEYKKLEYDLGDDDDGGDKDDATDGNGNGKDTGDDNGNAEGDNNDNDNVASPSSPRLPDPILFLESGIHIKMDELEKIVEHIERKRNFMQHFLATRVSPGIPELYYQLVNIQSDIVDLVTSTSTKDNSNSKKGKNKYPVSSVILTFETETYQRQVLEKMAVSPSLLNRSKKQGVGVYPHQELLFEGKHILNVHEPAEPSTIRWMDQDVTKSNEVFKIVLTFFVLALVATPIIVIRILQDNEVQINLTYVSWYIAASNASFPSIAKIICLKEKHKNEEDREVSLFVKIGVFRIVNTVLLVDAIQSYANHIMYGTTYLLDGVYKIFFAEIVTATALQYLDVYANFQRHVMAPRAKTQEKMNLAMRGSQIFLAERYTNMCKLFFMAVWYAPLYPAVLFMCSIALMINSVIDKFSIMRSWRRAPKIGRSIGRVTRQIIFPIIVGLMAYQGFMIWSNFPYDRLCETGLNATIGGGDLDSSGITVTYNIALNDDIMHISNTTSLVVEVGPDTPTYRICNHREEWEKQGRTTLDEQGRLNTIYERTFISIVAIAAGSMLLVIINFAKRYWKSSYERIGENQDKPYGKEESITAYIPQWKTDTSAFPFLVCPTEEIENCDLFNWEDPDRKYGFYDVTEDARQILEDAGVTLLDSRHGDGAGDGDGDGDGVDLSKVFSQMVHTPYEHPAEEG